MPPAKDQYTDDAPITDHNADRFGRWPFAERVAHVIATRADPASLVIGIYGPWGDGKTSVVNMMVEALTGENNVVVVPFNPWNFENEGQLIRAFFDTLADALKASLTTKGEEFGKFLGKYGGVLSLASIPFGVDVGGAAASIGDKLSNVELEELKTRLSAILVENGKRVVVFIDDVDRLDRGEVHALLKLIKLSASFHNTAYVLAFDDEMVAAALGERYDSGDVASGRSFIEKIIQVPLHLPDAESADLRTLCFEGVQDVLNANSIDLSEDDVEAFVRHFTDGILPALRTPRQVKRYVNAIRFAVPLLKGEVHVGDLLLLEGIRTVYPDLYLSIRSNQDTYTGRQVAHSFGDPTKAKEASKQVVEAGLKDIGVVSRDAALELLTALFPRLESVFGGTTYGGDWDATWSKGRRLTSDDYFRRYFQYAVPARDVADTQITALVVAANAGDRESVKTLLHDVTKRAAWQRALDKLFARRGDLNPTGAQTLALVLAGLGEEIPEERGMFASMMAAVNRAATLMADLVKSLPETDTRLAVARNVVITATPLSFAAEYLRDLSYQSKKKTDTTALTETEMAEVGAILASRIAKDLITTPNYAKHGRRLGGLLGIWKKYGPKGDMDTFLAVRFADHPEEAAQFLDAFIGRAYGLESGLSHKSSFDRNDFDNVAWLIDPTWVLAALKKQFGSLIDDATFDKCWELNGDQQTACRSAATSRATACPPCQDR